MFLAEPFSRCKRTNDRDVGKMRRWEVVRLEGQSKEW